MTPKKKKRKKKKELREMLWALIFRTFQIVRYTSCWNVISFCFVLWRRKYPCNFIAKMLNSQSLKTVPLHCRLTAVGGCRRNYALHFENPHCAFFVLLPFSMQKKRHKKPLDLFVTMDAKNKCPREELLSAQISEHVSVWACTCVYAHASVCSGGTCV